MSYFLKWVPLILISIVSSFHLIASLQPGKLEDFVEAHLELVLICYLFGFIFLLSVVATFLLFTFEKKATAKVPILLWRPNLWAIAILLVTLLLTHFHLPAKLGFILSYADFQRAVATPMSHQGKMVGSYTIEAVKQNPSGEIYFQTYNFWASAVTSRHGFVYKPHLQNQREQSNQRPPFGAHTYVHLFGDWYMFHGTTC